MLKISPVLISLSKCFHATSIDNSAFRLHYRMTFTILIIFSMIVTTKEYVGVPILCMFDKKSDPMKSFLDTYCWVTSTFTLPMNIYNATYVSAGLGNPTDAVEVRYQKYYQWVWLVLVFQAALFYTPHYLWKQWEGSKVRILTEELSGPIANDQERRNDRITLLAYYFHTYWHANTCYALKYFFCEMLNFVNVVVQMILMDMFLQNQFSGYGVDVFSLLGMSAEDQRLDPLALIFPKLTKCTFKRFGPTGGIERLDGLCLLPLNVVNEKIFIFLWFWFIFVSVISALVLLYRAMLVFCHSSIGACVLQSRAPMVPRKCINELNRYCDLGDWFLLCRCADNMDSILFKELAVKLLVLIPKDEREYAGGFHHGRPFI